MGTKHLVIGVVAFLFCIWLLMQLSQNASFRRTPPENTEDLNQHFAFTNLENSHGKVGQELWDSIKPAFTCPVHLLKRVGRHGDGGKYVCGLVTLGAYYESNTCVPCILYSFGVNRDSSFENEVLTNTRCSVYAYDPTVDHIGKPIEVSNARVHFFKMGVGGSNTKNRTTLKTMMEDNGGHEWIDILKMDVERSEYESFETIFKDFDQLPIGQLLIEMHYVRGNRTAASERIIELINNLELRGLRMFYKEVNEKHPQGCSEFSFINIRALERFLM